MSKEINRWEDEMSSTKTCQVCRIEYVPDESYADFEDEFCSMDCQEEAEQEEPNHDTD